MEDKYKKNSDAQNIADILDAVGDKIPTLIRNVTGSLYTREAGSTMGQAVGAYYKELMEAGIPAEAALEMTKDYSFSLRHVMRQGTGGGGGWGHRGGHGPGGFGFTYAPDDEDAETTDPTEET